MKGEERDWGIGFAFLHFEIEFELCVKKGEERD